MSIRCLSPYDDAQRAQWSDQDGFRESVCYEIADFADNHDCIRISSRKKSVQTSVVWTILDVKHSRIIPDHHMGDLRYA